MVIRFKKIFVSYLVVTRLWWLCCSLIYYIGQNTAWFGTFLHINK